MNSETLNHKWLTLSIPKGDGAFALGCSVKAAIVIVVMKARLSKQNIEISEYTGSEIWGSGCFLTDAFHLYSFRFASFSKSMSSWEIYHYFPCFAPLHLPIVLCFKGVSLVLCSNAYTHSPPSHTHTHTQDLASLKILFNTEKNQMH